MLGEEWLTRAIENIYPSREALSVVLASGKKLRVYVGIDPTGPAIHLGHAVFLWKLRELQDAGHEVVLLIGDFTAQVGDPTDKTATRTKLTPAQVKANFKTYRRQLGKILDLKKTKIAHNSRWLGKLKFADVLDLASEFTVSQMLERDMFQDRIKNARPIYLHEFLYPVMQGYDSVALDVDAELGGNDQTFNMLAGRVLLKRRGKEKFVIATKLLTDAGGKKMSKTEGNMVTLTDTADEMYGKVMSWPDNLLLLAFELCTRLPLVEMKGLVERDPLPAKKVLAKEIVRLYHSAAAATRAERHFSQTFQQGEAPEQLEEVAAALGETLAEALLRRAVVKSKGEWWRLVEEGAVHNLVTGEVVTDAKLAVTGELRLKIGKRRFVKIVPN